MIQTETKEERIEGELTKTLFVSLVTSFITLGLLYYLKLKYLPGFISNYGFYIFLAIISYAIILLPIRQVRMHREFPCMSGMMIGMTIGMISGFLPGFLVGATNGMFWGSVFGMTIGILFGTWNGKCCGIMGVMEGIMSGFMGGLMGAMTAIMMLNDNIRAAGVIVLIVSASILIGLSMLIYKETRSTEQRHREDHTFTIVWSFLLTVATIWLMVFGPRSMLFQ